MASAVLFDLFETLIGEWAQDRRWPLPGSPAAALGVPEEVVHAGWARWLRPRMTKPVSFAEVLRDICASGRVRPPPRVVQQLVAARQRSKAECFEVVRSDVLTTLSHLRASGVRLAVVSNCCVEEVEAFEGSALASSVDLALWSFDVGLAKPDPRIYKLACLGLGVDPADAFFVGDGSFGELAGAAEAGLSPIWATWFLGSWPAALSQERRAVLAGGPVPEAVAPADLVEHVLRKSTEPVFPLRR